MLKQIVINVSEPETRVALLEDGTIVELFIERPDDSDITGHIYKGRIQRVLPGMQAAFVDIGFRQASFIHVHDLQTVPKPNTTEEENDVPSFKIEDFLKEGDDILVQVVKPPIGTKGSRVTSHITLPGRYLVLMPANSHIGVSRRITDEQERARLRELVETLRENEFGYIVRTAAEGIQQEKIVQEMRFLGNIQENIRSRYQTAPSPSLIHQELNVILRAVRDLLIDEAEQLIIDSRAGYHDVLSLLDTFMPSLKESVKLYTGREPLFNAFNLEGDIARALKKKVWLKSGGYIVIEQTEALVAIDVNTGRFVGKHNLEETILKTNLEAVKEIAYQIRLRDLGGIVIIDFIDMEKTINQEKIFTALKEAMKKDRSKNNILPMSEMGLIQMTRKRKRQPLMQTLCEPCFYCDGEGRLLSGRTICLNLYRDILRSAYDVTGSRLTLRLHPEVAELLHGEMNDIIVELEQRIEKSIVIYPDRDFHFEAYEIRESTVS